MNLIRKSLIFAFTCLVGLATSAPTALAQDQRLRYGSRPGLNDSPLVFELPPTMGKRQLDRCAHILALSEAQRKFVDSLYEEYTERCREIDRKYVPLLLSAAQVFIGSNLGQRASLFAKLGAALEVRRLERELSAELEKEDQLLFAKTQAVLSEVQTLSMPRVLMYRQRDRCLTRFFEFSKAKVDFARLIEESDFPSELLLDLDPVMWEYEQASTPMFLKAESKRRNASTTVNELDMKAMLDDEGKPLDRSLPESAQRAADARAEKARIIIDCARSHKAIAELNDRWLPRFMENMPPEVAKAFQMAYLSNAYWRVYPDRTDPESLYLRISKSAALGEDLRMALDSAWNDYRSSYKAICKSMEVESDRWQEQSAFEDHTEGWQEHNSDMRRWTDERMKKNAEFIKRMEQFLPEELAAAEAPNIQEWKRLITERREDLRLNPRDYRGMW